MTILVMGCDKYSKSTFNLFHHSIEKYWKGHPRVIYSTETIFNPYYKTIRLNYPVQQWTKRLNETLKKIKSEIVLVCPEDTFFRNKVNYGMIKELCKYIDDKLIAINLEPPFDCYPVNEKLCIRNPNGKWLASFMPQLWNRKKLIELTEGKELSPRQAEHIGINTPYTFGIIATGPQDFDFGKKPNIYPYAITEGKWAREIVDFCEKENIKIDFSELGFYEGRKK